MTKPVRIQLSRKKGFSLQAESIALNGLPAVKVTRPGKWGNPFRVGDFSIRTAADAVTRFRHWLEDRVVGPKPPKDFEPLRGKNLACFCQLDAPCHADVLLEIANPPGSIPHSKDRGDE